MKKRKGTGWKFGTKQIKSLRIMILVGLLIMVAAGVVVAIDMPNPKKLSSNEYPESSYIMDRNGQLLYEIYADIRRTPVALSEVPENLINATLAIEDVGFYKHWGFDLRGIVRGLYRTVVKKRLQGGSTLTQQLVKNALLTPERTIQRKIKEALLTVVTELTYSKDQILEMYLNQTPYGGTMWGVQAAAAGIFGKDVKDLDLAEAALIAGLPASPTYYSPFAHPDVAKTRQKLVLTRMEEEGLISEEQKQEAEQKELSYKITRNEIKAPHFVFYVKEQLAEKYGLPLVTEGGLKVTTSLDLEMQDFVQQEVASEVAKLERYKVGNGAVLVTEPKTGQILAMVGSKDYWAEDIDGKFNVTTALRQPGSSIKPLNYAVGIETGKITAASVLYDHKTCFKVENQRDYCPTNYGYRYFGIQSVRNSLANSLNIPAVKVLALNGLETFVASASAMGISTFNKASDYGLSLTLGGGEVKMVDMATAFGVLANNGIRQDLVSILEVVNRDGEVLEKYGYVPGERKLSRETSFIISQILSDDGARSMVFGRGSKLVIKDHPEVSVKTGTTNDLRDNWTIGYTQDFVVTVWVGNNDNSAMSWIASGITGATPIWHEVMTKILEEKAVKKPVMPAEVVGIQVCNLTGKLPPEGGCETHFEYFKKEYVPTERQTIRANILINKDNQQMVKEGEEIPNAEWQERSAIRDAYGEWVCLDCPPPDELKPKEKKEE